MPNITIQFTEQDLKTIENFCRQSAIWHIHYHSIMKGRYKISEERYKKESMEFCELSEKMQKLYIIFKKGLRKINV